MEVVVTTGVTRHAKLQSNHHHQQTNTQFFTGQMPFLLPNQKQCRSTEGEKARLNKTWIYVLRLDLKIDRESLIGTICGSEFQTAGAKN